MESKATFTAVNQLVRFVWVGWCELHNCVLGHLEISHRKCSVWVISCVGDWRNSYIVSKLLNYDEWCLLSHQSQLPAVRSSIQPCKLHTERLGWNRTHVLLAVRCQHLKLHHYADLLHATYLVYLVWPCGHMRHPLESLESSPNQEQHKNNQPMLHYVGDRGKYGGLFTAVYPSDQ